MTGSFQSIFGLILLVGLAWGLSEKRGPIPWRLIAVALGAQVLIALIVLRVGFIADALTSLNVVVRAIEAASAEGARYIFGYLAGGDQPFEIVNPDATLILAFQVLPVVIVVSALAAVLWHWKILQLIAKGLSAILQRSLNIGGAVGLSAAINLFMGIVESPLFVRGYLNRLSRSELFMVMTLGMSTVSGVVLVLYSSVLQAVVGDAAVGHLLTASLISLPAAVLIAKLLVPDQGEPPTDAREGDADALKYEGTMDALAQGTQDGMQLFLAVIAMLIVIVALVALADGGLAYLGPVGGEPVTVPRLFGWLFAPVIWLIGIPWEEAVTAGALYGEKAILNEFFAYLSLAGLEEGALSERSQLIMIYALCGFANLGSVGMLITTLATLAPGRRAEAAGLGLKAWLAGNMATLMTGAVVGLMTFT